MNRVRQTVNLPKKTRPNLKCKKRVKNRSRPAIRPVGREDGSPKRSPVIWGMNRRRRVGKDENENEDEHVGLTGEKGEGLLILVGGLFDDVLREPGCGRGFIPIKRLKVVADELLIEAERAGTDLVRVGRPKP
jgi:hypothetical protein